MRLLSHAGLIDKLDAVVTASDVENHKPCPDTFLLAADRLGINAQNCLVLKTQNWVNVRLILLGWTVSWLKEIISFFIRRDKCSLSMDDA